MILRVILIENMCDGKASSTGMVKVSSYFIDTIFEAKIVAVYTLHFTLLKFLKRF